MRTAMDVSDEASSEVEPSDVASFAVGDTFSSYDDLKKKLAEFEKSHSVQLTQSIDRTEIYGHSCGAFHRSYRLPSEHNAFLVNHIKVIVMITIRIRYIRSTRSGSALAI